MFFSDYDTLVIVVAFFTILIVWVRYTRWGLTDFPNHDTAGGAWHQVAKRLGLEYEPWGYIGTYWGYELRLATITMTKEEYFKRFSRAVGRYTSMHLQKIELRNIDNAANCSLTAASFDVDYAGPGLHSTRKRDDFYFECKPESLAEALDTTGLRQRLQETAKAFECEVRVSGEILYCKSFFVWEEKALLEMIDLLGEIARSVEAVSI